MPAIDTTALTKLAADLQRAAATIEDVAGPVMEHWALDTKKAMQEAASGVAGGHGQHFPASISYDPAESGGPLAYEVGPDKERTQGPLGVFFYFGSVNNGALLDIEAGALETQPAAEKWLAIEAAGHLAAS